MKIHSNLGDVARVTRQYCDETDTLRSRYEQAYIAEQTKLSQSVAIHKDLEVEINRLKHETAYYQQHLIPDYERLVSRQRAEISEMQQSLQRSEDKCRKLEQKSCEELDEHKRATETMVELLRASEGKAEALAAGAKRGSFSSPRVSARLRQRHVGISPAAAAAADALEKRRTRGRGLGKGNEVYCD